MYIQQSVSTGLGMRDIAIAVSVCDMSAELSQEDAYVCFQLRVDSHVSHRIAVEYDSAAISHTADPFPATVLVLGIDDSPLALKTLESTLPHEMPGSVVQVFGETLAEVARFQRAIAEQCDIATFGKNLPFPGAEVKGTKLIKEILAAACRAQTCVRSVKCTYAHQREYLESSAHCATDKRVGGK